MGSLVCATRFKFYDTDGKLLTVVCPFCGESDSFEHFLTCRRVKTVPLGDEDLIEMLRALALRIEKASPAQPRPLRPDSVEEIVLGCADSSDDEISLSLC